MTARMAKGEEQFPVADESLYKRNVDESATKLQGPAKQLMNPKHVCNSEGLKFSFWAPAMKVKRTANASPDDLLVVGDNGPATLNLDTKRACNAKGRSSFRDSALEAEGSRVTSPEAILGGN